MTAQGYDIDSALVAASEKHGTPKTPIEQEDDIVFNLVEPASEATSKIAVDTTSPESEFSREEPTKPHSLHTIGRAVVGGDMSSNAALETIAQIEDKRRKG